MTRLIEAPVASAGGLDRAEWHIFVIFALLRTAFVIQGAIVTATEPGAYHPLGAVVAGFVVEAGWSGWLLRRSYHHRGYADPRLAALDVGITVAGLVIVSLTCPPGAGETWTNWMFPFALITVIGASFALDLGWAVASALVLAIAHVAGASRGFTISPGPTADTIGNSGSYLLYIVFAAVTSRMIRRSGRAQDKATSRALAAERKQAASDDRVKQFGRIHDDVLATLTLVAQGVLPLDAPAVRARAERNAQYLRDLMQGDVAERRSSGLAADLTELIRERRAEGMRITYRHDGIPDGLSEEVTAALLVATGESLTNIAKHATGTPAWVTALGDDKAVVVRIVDQGPGLPDTVNRGIGITHQVRGGMEAVGGRAEVTSTPGDGTIVELRWPA